MSVCAALRVAGGDADGSGDVVDHAELDQVGLVSLRLSEAGRVFVPLNGCAARRGAETEYQPTPSSRPCGNAMPSAPRTAFAQTTLTIGVRA